MKYLLDVNAAVAHLFTAHTHHARVRAWVLTLRRADAVLLTPWIEMGVIRVGLATRLLPDLATGQRLLRGMSAGAATISFVPDDSRADALPRWVTTPTHVGDGHLAALAAAQGARLATFDQGISGAFLIP